MQSPSRACPSEHCPQTPPAGSATQRRSCDDCRLSRDVARKHGSPDSGGPEPEPRLCLCGCGADLSDLRADAEFLSDTHSKRYRRKVRRQELLAPETLWAAEERQERTDWAALGEISKDRRVFRPQLVDPSADLFDPENPEAEHDAELVALMQGYFHQRDEGEHLHPMIELDPRRAKRRMAVAA